MIAGCTVRMLRAREVCDVPRRNPAPGSGSPRDRRWPRRPGGGGLPRAARPARGDHRAQRHGGQQLAQPLPAPAAAHGAAALGAAASSLPRGPSALCRARTGGRLPRALCGPVPVAPLVRRGGRIHRARAGPVADPLPQRPVLPGPQRGAGHGCQRPGQPAVVPGRGGLSRPCLAQRGLLRRAALRGEACAGGRHGQHGRRDCRWTSRATVRTQRSRCARR